MEYFTIALFSMLPFAALAYLIVIAVVGNRASPYNIGIVFIAGYLALTIAVAKSSTARTIDIDAARRLAAYTARVSYLAVVRSFPGQCFATVIATFAAVKIYGVTPHVDCTAAAIFFLMVGLGSYMSVPKGARVK